MTKNSVVVRLVIEQNSIHSNLSITFGLIDLISFDFIYLRRVALWPKPFFKGPSNKNIIIIITRIPKKTTLI